MENASLDLRVVAPHLNSARLVLQEYGRVLEERFGPLCRALAATFERHEPEIRRLVERLDEVRKEFEEPQTARLPPTVGR